MFDMRNLRIGTRLIGTTLAALLLMLVFVGLALVSLGRIGDRVDHLTAHNGRLIELAVDLRMCNLLIERRVRTALLVEEIAAQGEERQKVDSDLARYAEDEAKLLALAGEPQEKARIEELVVARQSAEPSIKRLFELLREGNRPEIDQHFLEDFRPKLQRWFDLLGDYVELQRAANVADVAEINEIRNDVRTMMLLLIGLAIVVMIPAGLWVTRQITRPLRGAVAVADAVAAGDFEHPVDTAGEDEAAQLMRALAKMQGDLKRRAEADRRVADEALRIKVALDVSSNNVMVADPDGRIIYCNASLLGMMAQAERDIREQLPDFRAADILGGSFDRFHRQPGHQRNLLAGLNGAHRAEITIGGRYFSLVASPIINEQGARLGTVVEWRDRTAEIRVEDEVAAIIAAAAAGDFSRRIDSGRMAGFFRQIADGINQLLEANSTALGDLGAMLGGLSQGDLTQRIDADYRGMLGQLKDDANATVDQLQTIVLSIKEATDAINTAAKEIASGNQDLSSRTEEQASSLQETASSMEQLTSTVKQNADNAQQANELAGNAQQVAEKGGAVVGEVVKTMSAIHQSSSKIADIIGVIDGIAFQTNILALNAAVEAARAGEQGRGFAVVATEVRNLAQRSAAAAKEIKGLISDSVEKVEAGNKLVDQAGRTMSEVVASIERVARIMADITDASREQSAGIEQVSLAVSQMDEVTQQNAALVEQAAAAAESLEEQAHSLKRAVAVFSLARRNSNQEEGKMIESRPVVRRVERAALPHREPVRLNNTLPKADIRIPVGAEDEWAEF